MKKLAESFMCRFPALALAALLAAPARADTTSRWVNAAGGEFWTGANWDTGVAPATTNDNAVFTNLSGTITFSAPVSNKLWSVQRGNFVFDIGAGQTNWLLDSLLVGATNPALAQAAFTSGTLVFTNGSIYVGRNVWPSWGGAHTLSTNVLVVSGPNTMITNTGVTAGFVIFVGGYAAAQLIVTNGAVLNWSARFVTVQSGVRIAPPPYAGQTNLFRVTGPGSKVIVVGSDTAASSLMVGIADQATNATIAQIDDGGYMYCPYGVCVGSDGPRARTLLRVSGATSELVYAVIPLLVASRRQDISQSQNLYRGEVEILNGGRITAADRDNSHLWIGVRSNHPSLAATGTVTIAGSNSLFFNSGPSREFTNLLGQAAGGYGRLVVTNCGTLRTTNTMGRAALDVQNGAVTLDSGGQIIVDNLLMASTSAAFNFQGGTLSIGNSTVSNNSAFTAGNGVNPAGLEVRGGTHAFYDGLTIATNAALSPLVSGVATSTLNGSLTLQEGAIYNWEYGAAGADLVDVNGTLTLPTIATLNVTNLGGGTLPGLPVLFTADTLAGNQTPRWNISGVTGLVVRVVDTNVVLTTLPSGTIVMIR